MLRDLLRKPYSLFYHELLAILGKNRTFPFSFSGLSVAAFSFSGLAFSIFCAAILSFASVDAFAQLSSGQMYYSFQNQLGVADTLSERLIAGRQAGQAPVTEQALEQPVDPATYMLGPGDGVFLDIYALHGLDQDLVVTPEGRLLIPAIGSVDVSGLSIIDAQKKVKELISKDYKSAEVSLSLRHLRPMKVSIAGDVLAPGLQTTTALQRVSEVIDKSGGFKPNSSLRNIEIRSATGLLRARADLIRFYALGDLSANPVVEAGDVIIVPQESRYILVSGTVGNPQKLEYVEGDSLSTVLALCRGFLPASDKDSIEIARFPQNDPVHAEWLWVDYAKGENPRLQEGDQIFIRAFSQYHVPRLVSIDGQVPFPGQYPIIPGVTRLKDIILRCGGILPNGSLSEAQLIRRSGIGSWVNDAEFKRIQTLSTLRPGGLNDAEYDYYSARMEQVYHSLMVVDFKALMDGDASQNLVLREEDSIYIPRAMGFVTVSGAVNRQGNIEYIEGGTYRDYIDRAGGFSPTADKSEVRVVNPGTGSYIDPRSGPDYPIAPGDMIIVPQEDPHFWKDFATVTTVTAQIVTIFAGIYLLIKNK